MTTHRRGDVGIAAPVVGLGAMSWLLGLTQAVAGMDRSLTNLLLTPIQQTLGLGDAQLGFLQGPGFGLLYSLAIVPAGMLVDRSDRIRLLLVALAGWTAGTIGLALAWDFCSLIAARLLIGLAQALIVPAGLSLIVDCVRPDARGRAIALFTASSAFGRGAALIVSGILLAILPAGIGAGLEPWRLTLLATLPFNVVLAAFLLTRPEPARRMAPLRERATLIEAWRVMARSGRGFASLFVLMVAGVTLIQALAAWAPTFLVRQHGATLVGAGVVVGTVTLAAAPLGNLAAGALIDSLVRRGRLDAHALVMAGAFLTFLPFAAVFCLAPSFLAAASGLFCCIFAASPAISSGLATLQTMSPPAHLGKISGTMLAATTLLSGALGPLMIGVVSQDQAMPQTALGVSIWLVTSAVAIGGALVALSTRRLTAGDPTSLR